MSEDPEVYARDVVSGRAPKRVSVSKRAQAAKRKAKKRNSDVGRYQPRADRDGRRAGRGGTITFAEVSRDRWATAFGTADAIEQAAKFRAALEEQRRRKTEQESQRSEDLDKVGAGAVMSENKGAGRRLYGSPTKGRFDFGLGQMIYGRSDRNRKMRALGLREAH